VEPHSAQPAVSAPADVGRPTRWSRLPRAARLGSYLVGTRLWVWLWLCAGSYFPKPFPSYWKGHDGALQWFNLPCRALDVFGRWDTEFYTGIARNGYPRPGADGGWVFNAAYFPLFPSLMRGLSTLLGGLDVYLCGVLIAQGMLGLAVVYMDKLARLDHPEEQAETRVLFLLVYCGSHFFSCVYPESTALFLCVFALYCARTGKAWISGMACALAAVTRSSGILLVLPVLYELWQRPDGKRWPSRRVWVLGLVPLTVGMMMALHFELYGDPLYFVHVQAGWGRKPTLPLLSLFQPTGLTVDFHLFAIATVALVGVGLWRRRERTSHLILATANVALPLSTGILNGIYRYMGSNFPLFFLLGDELADKPRARRLYVGIGLLTLALFSFKWGQGYQPN